MTLKDPEDPSFGEGWHAGSHKGLLLGEDKSLASRTIILKMMSK